MTNYVKTPWNKNGKRRKMRYLSLSTRVCLNNSATARPICRVPAGEMWHLVQRRLPICLKLFFASNFCTFDHSSSPCEWSSELCTICLYLFSSHFSGKTWHLEPITVRYLKRDIWYVNSHGHGQYPVFEFVAFVKSSELGEVCIVASERWKRSDQVDF